MTIMDELELPEIALPAHQRQLRVALMRAHAAQRPGPLASIKGFAGGMLAVRAWRLRAAATAVVLLLAVGHQVLWRPGPAAAFVIVQVNPSIELGIDREQVVVSARGLDATGVELLAAPARLELRRRPLEEALAMLTDRLVAGQQVVTGGRVVLAVRMVREEAAPGAQPILARAQEVVQRRLAAAGVGAVTAGLVVDSALYQSAARLGFLPADYVELIALDLGREAVLEVLALGGELGIPRPVFAEKLDTLAASLAGLSEVGVTTSQAMAVLRASARADLSLEASDAIVEGVIDLVAKGVPLEQVLGLLALQHDTALRLDGLAFLKEVSTLMDALVNLHEAGFTGDSALALLRSAVVVDPTLEESGTIVAAVIDLVQAGVPLEQGLAVLALQHDAVLRLPPEVFRKEVTTLLGALVDLSTARITGELALAVIRTAAGADPALEEFARIVEAVMQLVEGGVAPSTALAKVQQALVTDPTLGRFEELLGIKGEGRPGDPAEDREEPGQEEPGEEEPGEEEPGQEEPGEGEPGEEEPGAEEPGEEEPAGPPATGRVEEENRPGVPPAQEEAKDDDVPAAQPAGGSSDDEPTLPTSEEAGEELGTGIPPLEQPEENEGGAEEPAPDEPDDDDEGLSPPG